LQIVRERLPAIVGDEERHAEDIDPLIVRWIDADLTIVERPRAEVVELLPGLAVVLGAKDAADIDIRAFFRGLPGDADVGLVGLHEGVDDLRVLAVDGEPAAAERSVREAVRHLVPGLAAVLAAEESGIGAVLRRGVAAGVAVAAHAVGRSVEALRLTRIDGDINEAGVL